MAIRKSELFHRCITEQQCRDILALEIAIDAKLRSDYTSDHCGIVIVDIKKWPDKTVRQEIGRRFSKAGWTVNFDVVPDQMVDSIRLS